MKRTFAALAAIVPALALAEPAAWKIDPAHTQSNFSIRHLVGGDHTEKGHGPRALSSGQRPRMAKGTAGAGPRDPGARAFRLAPRAARRDSA